MNTKEFIKALIDFESENVFNPYRDLCLLHDQTNANKVRLKNLELILDAAVKDGIESLWIGRDLGHRGGRRTGLALTDEVHLSDASDKWAVSLSRATKGEMIKERTATNIWQIVNLLEKNVFMWNVFPFHPHESNNPFTNRNHTAHERDAGLAFLDMLINILKPEKVIAIGNDAYNATVNIIEGEKLYKVRHPSYGGEKTFSKQLNSLYGYSS